MSDKEEEERIGHESAIDKMDQALSFRTNSVVDLTEQRNRREEEILEGLRKEVEALEDKEKDDIDLTPERPYDEMLKNERKKKTLSFKYDSKLNEVEEMLKKEEEIFAELEKKVNEMEETDEKEDSEESVTYGESGGDQIKEIDEETEDERKLASEEWMSDLVPNLHTAFQPEGLVSDDGSSFFYDEEAVTEAVEQAKNEMVLDEDNPMVKRFQTVLREHLLRVIEKLTTSIREHEGECKMKESELKIDEENAYVTQQIILRQRENIQNYQDKINDVVKLRNQFESQSINQEDDYISLRKTYDEKKSEMEESQAEAEMLGNLVRQMSEYDKEQEKEIAYSKRRQDINMKDKERLSKEKQAQDMLLWKLQKQLLEKRRESDACLKRCKSKSEECQVVSSKLLQATVERAGILMENHGISKELQKSFFHIKQIDATLQKTKDELEDVKNNWEKLKMNLKWYKKESNILMEENEQIMEERRKSKDEYEFMMDKIEILKGKKFRIMEELNSYEELLQSAGKDLQDVIQLGISLKADEEILFKQISKASNDKAMLEKAYIEKLSSHERTDKLVKNMNGLISKSVEEHKKQEIKMIKLENDLARLMAEMEAIKGLIRDLEYETGSINRNINEFEEYIRKIEDKLKVMKTQEANVKNSIHDKKKQLEQLQHSLKHKTYMDTPLLVKKQNLLQAIEKLQKSIDEKETIWLEMQEGCLRATKKRNKQLETINEYKKKLSMVDVSLERVGLQIKQEQQGLRETMSELKTVTHRMELLQETEVKQGQAKQKAEEMNKDREDAFVDLLKELERAVLTIQQDIWDLEEGNQEKAETVEMLQKEFLEWNKKYDLALQMRKEIENEKSEGGEIAAMKQEIHRMEVRYANLRKAEEKLISDLEVCLSRRDSIVDLAEAREKRMKSSGETVKALMWRRLQHTKTKLRTIIRDVGALKKEKEACLEKRKNLSDELSFWRNSVKNLSESLLQLEQQIQEGQIHRHKTLEITVMRQRKAKLLEDLRMGRFRVSFSEDDLTVQEENVMGTRNALLHILDELKNDFPTLYLQLTQIENTISFSIDPE